MRRLFIILYILLFDGIVFAGTNVKQPQEDKSLLLFLTLVGVICLGGVFLTLVQCHCSPEIKDSNNPDPENIPPSNIVSVEKYNIEKLESNQENIVSSKKYNTQENYKVYTPQISREEYIASLKKQQEEIIEHKKFQQATIAAFKKSEEKMSSIENKVEKVQDTTKDLKYELKDIKYEVKDIKYELKDIKDLVEKFISNDSYKQINIDELTDIEEQDSSKIIRLAQNS